MARSICLVVMRVLFCFVAASQAYPAPSFHPVGTSNSIIPVGSFFANESTETFRLSPKGCLLAFLHFDGRSNVLCVGNPEKLATSTTTVVGKDEGDVFSFLWVDENCLAFAARSPKGTRVGCMKLSNSTAGGTTGGEVRILAREEDNASLSGVVHGSDSLLAQVILSVPSTSHSGFEDIFRADPASGIKKLLHKNVEGLSVWNISEDGKTLTGIRCHSDGGSELLVIKSGVARVLMRCKPGESLRLCGIHTDGSCAYVVTDCGRNVEYSRLESVNLATGTRIILAADPERLVDFGEPVFDRNSKHLLGARYFHDRSVYQWYSRKAKNMFAVIK